MYIPSYRASRLQISSIYSPGHFKRCGVASTGDLLARVLRPAFYLGDHCDLKQYRQTRTHIELTPTGSVKLDRERSQQKHRPGEEKGGDEIKLSHNTIRKSRGARIHGSIS
jgi:hypothetical protein